MATFHVVLERKIGKRINQAVLRKQINHIVGRGVGGNRSRWSCVRHTLPAPQAIDDLWVYRADLTFRRQKVRRNMTPTALQREMVAVLDFVQKSGRSTKFGDIPWVVREHKSDWMAPVEVIVAAHGETSEGDIGDVINFNKALSVEDLHIPEVLVTGTDKEIEEHPAFKGLYGVSAYIRVMASSIRRMIDTNGMKRNHACLWGLPACGKSHIFMGFQQVLGPGAFLAINANSATKAGIERIFLDRLKVTGTPPIFFIEEMEKTLEAILSVWLSILDDRAEVRKITHQRADRVEARVLCFATVNDKVLFDRLHGGRPGYPGALSSRFTKKLYVPRPTSEIMRQILNRDIQLYGGKRTWVEPCLQIATELGTNDPRIVLSLLDGADRLLDGSYREDILRIHTIEKEETKQQAAFVDEIVIEKENK